MDQSIDWNEVRKLAADDLTKAQIVCLADIDEEGLARSPDLRRLLKKHILKGRAEKRRKMARRIDKASAKGRIAAISLWEKIRPDRTDDTNVEYEFELETEGAIERLIAAIDRVAETGAP